MITIYHNSRCSKSRCGLEILENSGKEFKIVKYLDAIPTKTELKNIIELLGINPIELVRKNESVWKENYKGKAMTDKDVLMAMIKHPKLIERPIIIKDNKAIIGRPPEKIIDFI